MNGIWAIARHTVAEALRMKIAVVFLVLIGLLLVGLPFSLKENSSLTDAVQSFLSYSLSASGLLLGLLTIFLSRSLSDELTTRNIFLVMTKPLPRWQYVIGKWLGITVLNTVFLAATGGVIVATVHFFKATHRPLDPLVDELELVNEVLVARHALKPKLPNFAQPAELEFQRNLEEGLYDNQPQFDPEAVKRDLAKKYEARFRFVGPQQVRAFEFENILCRRSPDEYVQLRYKTDVTEYPPDEVFRSAWRFGNPTKGTPLYEHHVRHVVGRYQTIRVKADAVAPDHTLTVVFLNRNPYEGEPQFANVMEFKRSEEMEVLFVVGGFTWNLVRLLSLTLCKLFFLAGVSILAATVFSFPVAALASFTVYVLAGTRSFINQALDFVSDDWASMFTSAKEFLVGIVGFAYNSLFWVIPDFSRYDAVEEFVNGRSVSLVWVLDAVFWVVLVRTGIVLLLAALAFQRRELAEVSL